MIEILRQKIPISRLAGSSSRRIKCPFHNSNDPDMALNHTNNTFKCYGCGVYGHIVHWVMHEHSLQFKDALEYLARSIGLSLHTGPTKKSVLLATAMSAYRLAFEHYSPAYKYMESRGFDRQFCDQMNIGYASKCIPHGMSKEDIYAAGLTYHDNYDLFFQDRIMFSVRDRYSRVVQIQGRALGDQKPKYLNLRSDAHTLSLRDYLYGEEQLNGSFEMGYLCEGIPDALSLRKLGKVAFGVFGNDGYHQHAYKLAKFKNLCVIMDNDKSTQSKLLSELVLLQAKLPNTNIYNISIPQESSAKTDVNLWCLAHDFSVDAFNNMAESNYVSVPSWVINKWHQDPRKHLNILEMLSNIKDNDRYVNCLAKMTAESPDSIRFAMKAIGGICA